VRENIRKQFCNEAVLWRQLKHPNILPLLGVNIKLFDPSFCLITPWMGNGDIISYSKQNTTHNRHTALLEIAAGLSYLHSRNPPITHGDIRGANILVTDDAHCCLADFGLAIITVGSQSLSTATTGNMKGSLRWMAPELIHVDGQAEEASLNNPSRDIYAFGCTVIEILTLQYPFHNIKTDYGVLASLMSGARPDRPQNAWCTNAIWDLTSRCWAQHASARPKAHEVYISLEQSFQGHPSSTPPPQAPMNIQPPVDMKDSQGIIGTRLL
jgi:serine/threonine protein kinase